MEPVAQSSFIAIARVVRSRGIRGEVVADLCTDFPARFSQLQDVWLEFADQRRQLYRLEESWLHKGRPVLKFVGIDSIESARPLIGAYVEVEAAQAMPLPEGFYYDHNLIGCVVKTLAGEVIGKVDDILRIAGNSQFVISSPKGEVLIPAVAAICKEVSISRKEILVDMPEGLMELNR